MRATFTICLLALALATPLRAEDDWYPSKYGAEDRLGAINNLSPAKVLEASKLIRTGKTYALGVVTGRETPAYGTRSFQILTMTGGDASGPGEGPNLQTGNDDLLLTWLGIGTQLDGLGHVGIGHRYYNGTPVSEFLRPDGLLEFGMHTLPPIVTRGVLLDVAALSGVERLAAGTAINREEIDSAARRQGVEIRHGDVVILNTGWQALAESDPEGFLSGEPGLGMAGAEYLAGLGVVAVGADGWALEVLPSEDETEVFPVHQLLLAKNGVYILENIRTDELVADEAWEFLFVLGLPRFEGAVQMVINPVAIR